MKDDPIVEEIRKYRQEHAYLYETNLDKIYLAIKEKEKKYVQEFQAQNDLVRRCEYVFRKRVMRS